MVYAEYLNAARKHLATCEVLKNEISQLNINISRDRVQERKLLLNLYYMTGYVFECSIKYGIYQLVDFDSSVHVNKLEMKGLNYENQIKHHRFDKYSEHLIVRSSGIELVDDNRLVSSDVKHLYNSWDAHVRYWYKNVPSSIDRKLTRSNLFSFYEYAGKTFDHVSNL